MTQPTDVGTSTADGVNRYPVFDADVHPHFSQSKPEVLAYLPERWQSYVAEWGVVRPGNVGGDRPRHREFSARWDAEAPEGGAPMTNREFAREQLLDKYDVSAAMLNDIGTFAFSGARGTPRQLAIEMCRATNQEKAENWFASDPRWYGSITAPFELPEAAAEEIRRCKEEMGEYGDRWRQVLLAPDNLFPVGHERYWPIYEICEHYGIPVGFHVLGAHRVTPSGSPNYYFEEHVDWAAFNFPLVSSFVFEGVFDRFPALKVALVELSWSWAVPFMWRLDSAYREMRSEVPHLTRLPSEYVRDHFWYTTQPMEEAEHPGGTEEMFAIFEESGLTDKLMYSSDYPHWDFDEPTVLPLSFAPEQRRRILGENASRLYDVPLRPGTGVVFGDGR
jgi:predicted TIM-barrel fold metal-dependent hydrolase